MSYWGSFPRGKGWWHLPNGEGGLKEGKGEDVGYYYRIPLASFRKIMFLVHVGKPNYSILFMINIVGHTTNEGINTKNILNINMDTLYISTHIIWHQRPML